MADLKERALEIKAFLEKNGVEMNNMSTDIERRRYFSSRTKHHTRFIISHSEGVFKFHWEADTHNRSWFGERNTAVEKIFSGSHVTEGRKCRLIIPVNQVSYCKKILEIVQKTRGYFEW
jgi:hypothetical protein